MGRLHTTKQVLSLVLALSCMGALTACNGGAGVVKEGMAEAPSFGPPSGDSSNTDTTPVAAPVTASATTVCTAVDNTITQNFTGAGGSIADIQTGSAEHCVTGSNLEVVLHPASSGSGCIATASNYSFDHNMVVVGNIMYQFWTYYSDMACSAPSSRLIRKFSMTQLAGDSTTTIGATPFELTPINMTYEAYDADGIADGVGNYGACAPTSIGVTNDVSYCSWMGSSIGVKTYNIFRIDPTSRLFSIGQWFALTGGYGQSGSSNYLRFRVLGGEYILP